MTATGGSKCTKEIAVVGTTSCCGLVLILIGIVLFALIGSMLTNTITQGAQIRQENEETWSGRKEPDLPGGAKLPAMLFNYTFWHLTNYQAFLAGDAPAFEEKGPYVYEQKNKKIEIDWLDDGKKVEFVQVNWYEERPELHGPGLNPNTDKMMTLDPNVAGAMALTGGEQGWAVIVGFAGMLTPGVPGSLAETQPDPLGEITGMKFVDFFCNVGPAKTTAPPYPWTAFWYRHAPPVAASMASYQPGMLPPGSPTIQPMPQSLAVELLQTAQTAPMVMGQLPGLPIGLLQGVNALRSLAAAEAASGDPAAQIAALSGFIQNWTAMLVAWGWLTMEQAATVADPSVGAHVWFESVSESRAKALANLLPAEIPGIAQQVAACPCYPACTDPATCPPLVIAGSFAKFATGAVNGATYADFGGHLASFSFFLGYAGSTVLQTLRDHGMTQSMATVFSEKPATELLDLFMGGAGWDSEEVQMTKATTPPFWKQGMYTGIDDIQKTHQVYKNKGIEEVQYWKEHMTIDSLGCRAPNQWPPFADLRNPEQTRKLWSGAHWKCLEFEAAADPIDRFGVHANRFLLKTLESYNGDTYYSAAYPGFMNVTGFLPPHPTTEHPKRAAPLPTYASNPHMYGEDPPGKWSSRVGMKPDEAKHRPFLDVEPITGLTIGGSVGGQFNILLDIATLPVTFDPNKDQRASHDQYMVPMVTVAFGLSIEEDLAKFFKKALYGTKSVRVTLLVILLIVGIVVGIVGGIFYWWKKRQPPKTVPTGGATIQVGKYEP